MSKNRELLFLFVSWIISLALILAIFFLRYSRGFGGFGTETAYLVAIASLCLTFIMLVRGLPFWASAAFFIFVGSPLMAGASFLIAPTVGYGGQIINFALKTIIVAISASCLLLVLFRKFSLTNGKALKILLFIQVAMVLAGFVFSGAINHISWLEERGSKVSIRSIRLEKEVGTNPVLSCPLIEDNRLFVMTKSGFFYEVNLEKAKIISRISLPMPTPAEAGYPDLRSLKDETSAKPVFGKISRISASLLKVEYPFYMYRLDDYQSGWGYSSAGYWSIEAEIDLQSKTIASWQIKQGESSLSCDPRPIKSGQFEAKWGDYRDSLHILGPNTDSRVWTKGWASWLEASPPYFITGTTKGMIYVVTVPQF